MKIFLYGFKPYRKYKTNISQKVVKKIKKGKGMTKKVFPVYFNKKQYVDAVKKARPDLIIGLGQRVRGNKLKIERKTYNVKKVNKKAEQKEIVKNAPLYYKLRPRVEKDLENWDSYFAGNYVCNYSIYIISQKFKNPPFIFIHVPIKYDYKKAVKYVENLISNLIKNTPEEIKQKKLTKYI